jgi:hypothetical protein
MLIRPCYLRPSMYFRVRVKIFSDPIVARHDPGALRNADGSPLFEGDVVSVSMSVCPVCFASAAYSSTCCIIGESGDTHRMHVLAPHMKHATTSKIAWVAGMPRSRTPRSGARASARPLSFLAHPLVCPMRNGRLPFLDLRKTARPSAPA